MKVIKSADDAVATIGQELGVSRWVDIDQGRIDCRFGRPELGRDLLCNKHLIHVQSPLTPRNDLP